MSNGDVRSLDTTLPQGWAWTTLGQVRRDGAKGIDPSQHPSEQFELYSVPRFEVGVPDFVAGRDIGSNKQIVEPGAVLLCKINPRINRAWVVGEYSQRRKIASTEWIPFFRQVGIEPDYLRYYLSIQEIRDYLAMRASGVGGSLMRISPQTISDYPFPVAPLPEQRRIVAAIEQQFTRLDAGVAALKRAQARLKRYRASVLKAAVEGELTAGWRAAHPATETGGALLRRILVERRAWWEADLRAKGKDPAKARYVEPLPPDGTELPEVPNGWATVSLEQLTSAVRPICYGILMPKENVADGVLYVKVKDMKGDRIDVQALHRTTPEIAAAYGRSSLKADDLLLAIRGTYGRVARIPAELEGANITQDSARLDISDLASSAYIESYLRSPSSQRYFRNVARGVAVKGVNISDVRLAPIALPPLTEQEEIVAEVERRLSVVTTLETTIEANLKRAERLRQSVLREAFAGRLVAQDPTDEPADALLERIRMARSDAPPGGRRRAGRHHLELGDAHAAGA